MTSMMITDCERWKLSTPEYHLFWPHKQYLLVKSLLKCNTKVNCHFKVGYLASILLSYRNLQWQLLFSRCSLRWLHQSVFCCHIHHKQRHLDYAKREECVHWTASVERSYFMSKLGFMPCQEVIWEWGYMLLKGSCLLICITVEWF